MIKNNKWKLIISSAIILSPIIAGLLLWNGLPDKVATHWNFAGEVDGYSSKGFAVFFLPSFLLFVHWLCTILTTFDKKNQGQNKKAMSIVFWICPAISILTSSAIYAHSFGIDFNIAAITMVLLGLMFIVIGNYMPKIKQNSTLGVKVPWTLKNEENWNATHRFCGKVWVIGGFVILPCAFLPQTVSMIIMLTALPLLVIIPIIYSYIYHKKQSK